MTRATSRRISNIKKLTTVITTDKPDLTFKDPSTSTSAQDSGNANGHPLKKKYTIRLSPRVVKQVAKKRQTATSQDGKPTASTNEETPKKPGLDETVYKVIKVSIPHSTLLENMNKKYQPEKDLEQANDIQQTMVSENQSHEDKTDTTFSRKGKRRYNLRQ